MRPQASTRTVRSAAITAAIVMGHAVIALAQAPAPAPAAASAAQAAAPPAPTVTAVQLYSALPAGIQKDLFGTYAGQVVRRRVDHQTGVAGGAAGLAAGAGLGDLIDLAVESGAVTRTFEQNVVTVRANAAGLWRFFSNRPTVGEDASPTVLDQFEMSATIDAGEGGTTHVQGVLANTSHTVTLTPAIESGRVTSAAVKWSSRPGNVRAVAQKRWVSLRDTAVQSAFTNVRLTGGSLEATDVTAAVVNRLKYELEHAAASHYTDDGDWTFAFEGRRNSLALQPVTFTGRFIAGYAPAPCDGCGNTTLALNVAWTRYEHPQPTDGREMESFRDLAGALQFDRAVGPQATPVVLSVGAYTQWQRNSGILEFAKDLKTLPGTTIAIPVNGLKVLTEQGWLRVFQIGLELTLPGGVRAPLSFTYSNRTEFRNKPDARAFIGLLLNTW